MRMIFLVLAAINISLILQPITSPVSVSMMLANIVLALLSIYAAHRS
jgi:hypothetical protein